MSFTPFFRSIYKAQTHTHTQRRCKETERKRRRIIIIIIRPEISFNVFVLYRFIQLNRRRKCAERKKFSCFNYKHDNSYMKVYARNVFIIIFSHFSHSCDGLLFLSLSLSHCLRAFNVCVDVVRDGLKGAI